MQADSVTDEVLAQCSALFSSSYGVWGAHASEALRGQRVKMSAARLRSELLNEDSCRLGVAVDSDSQVVGHAFSKIVSLGEGRQIAWCTQLVVKREFRNIGVASRLLRSIWGFTNMFGWGICS